MRHYIMVAIDFKALLKEEREKRRQAAAAAASSASSGGEVGRCKLLGG